ncbi:MAG: CCA tRNA nucleotidyltransferase [Dehalococcoidia bacterium]|nr:CCA tRNA nucleotidyltransferase [Dehalococcoidia bacterium]
MGVTREQFIEAFRSSGHELWLVGGALRDRLLGLDSKDLDYSTDADPDAIEAIAGALGAPVTTVGKRFGTIGALVGGEWSEITAFRGHLPGRFPLAGRDLRFEHRGGPGAAGLHDQRVRGGRVHGTGSSTCTAAKPTCGRESSGPWANRSGGSGRTHFASCEASVSQASWGSRPNRTRWRGWKRPRG